MDNKKITRLIYIVSAAVLGLVVLLYNLPQAENIPAFVKYLPKLHASINATCFVLLLISLRAIKQNKVDLHKKLNLTAFTLSALFILSYVTYHSFGIETKFPADNPLRPLYFFILVSHIILATIVLPLILLSFHKAIVGDIPAHKKITKWSMPIWIYVTFTGVVVYFMISPYYTL
jgi:putative membrane protein